jgi:hypothetical protein
MKAYSKLIGVVVVMTILASAISLPFFALAQDYTLLEKSVLPGDQETTNFATYIESGFKTFLAVVVIIAIVMLTASGLQYITAGSGGGKGEAKNRALAALLGLLIALSAYLILQTINPDLVDLTLDINDQTSAGGRDISPPTNPPNTGGGGGGGSGRGEDTGNGEFSLNEQEARDKLKSEANITVNKNPCPPNTRYQDVAGGCTTIEGLPDNAIDETIKFKKDCDKYLSSMTSTNTDGECDVIITGGAELGHQTHGPGKDIVDIDDTPEVVIYISQNGTHTGTDQKGWEYYDLGKYTYVRETDETGKFTHFHRKPKS